MNEIYFISSVFVFGLIVAITPGPNNLMLFSSALNFGFKKTLPHAIGIWFGNIIMLILCGAGLATVFIGSPLIRQIMKIISIFFILYLAWKFGTTPPKNIKSERVRKPLNIFQASLFQWVNPKAWIFTVGAITLFTTGKNIFKETFTIGYILVLTMIISTTAWSCGGYFLQKLLKSQKQQKIFNIIMGIILALTIIPIIFCNS